MSVKYLDNHELSNLFSTIKKSGSTRDMVQFSLAYRYGLRVSEIVNIKLIDINPSILQPSEIFIRRSKNGISRHYPMSLSDAKLIKRWDRGRRVLPNADHNEFLFITNRSLNGSISVIAVQKAFERYCRLAGIPRAKAHVHTVNVKDFSHLFGKDFSYRFGKQFSHFSASRK